MYVGKGMKRQRARYARFTNRFLVLFCLCALLYFARGAVMMLADPQWWWLGVLEGVIALVFVFEIVWHAGYLVVDERGARLCKLWTRVELPWEEVRCVSRFTYLTGSGHRYRSYNHHRNVVLLSPLAEPWAAEGVGSDLHFTGNVLRFGSARSLCVEDWRGLREAIEANCPLPWTPLTCRCIEKKHVYTFDPPKEGGSADDVGTGRNER